MRVSSAILGALVAGAAVLLLACAASVQLAPYQVARPCARAWADAAPAAPVEWLGPVDASDRDALDAWCQTVGPPVISPSPSAPPLPADHLAIVGWNVHVGAGDVEALVVGLRTGRFTDGERVSQVVLALQEAYRATDRLPILQGSSLPVPRAIRPPGRRDDIVTVAARLGLGVFYVPSMRNGAGMPGEDRGNAILSSLPLADLQAIELPLERQRRVAIAATLSGLEGSGAPWTLRIVNVHLDALAGADKLWVGGPRARLRQAGALAGTLPREEPIVVAGDLNAWGGPSEEAVQVLARRFPDHEADERPTFRRQRLDYLFHRLPAGWHGRVVRLEERFGSDHYPLMAIVRTSR